MHAGHPIGDRPPAFVENVRQHLRRPGDFYYDRSNAEVLYLPRAGENMSVLEAVMPVEVC
jgi:hypothetical protein